MADGLEVYLDGEPLAAERATLLCAFQAAIKRAGEAGRVVVEVEADGAPLPEEVLSEPPDTECEYSEVRFASAEPRSMVYSILLDAAEALDRVIDDQRQASEDIQAGHLEEARSGLERITSVWRAVVLRVQRGAILLDLDLNDLSAGDPPAPVGEHVAALEQRIRELFDQLKQEDWSAVADALEEEFVALAGRWAALLRDLAEQVRPAHEDNGHSGEAEGRPAG